MPGLLDPAARDSILENVCLAEPVSPLAIEPFASEEAEPLLSRLLGELTAR